MRRGSSRDAGSEEGNSLAVCDVSGLEVCISLSEMRGTERESAMSQFPDRAGCPALESGCDTDDLALGQLPRVTCPDLHARPASHVSRTSQVSPVRWPTSCKSGFLQPVGLVIC
ncbi:unnamed protein product [Rangifer tarandus platyrhynchus]|uniref:Uncharacterized protein n=1 Tax=Rangifer tarandus platyrhynchus TaxID=3082113 RepID=A0AC59YMY8_RANTA